MLKFLYPKEYLSSVYEITAEKLHEMNIDTLIFDIDNTLVPYWIKVPDDKLINYFNELRMGGIKLGVLSNSKEKRSRVFCGEVNIPYVYRAKKPMTTGFERIMDKLDSKAENTMIIGDQIFTDVWCGNRAGAYSVLVKQVDEKDEWITWTKRGIEKIVVRAYLRSEANKK